MSRKGSGCFRSDPGGQVATLSEQYRRNWVASVSCVASPLTREIADNSFLVSLNVAKKDTVWLLTCQLLRQHIAAKLHG